MAFTTILNQIKSTGFLIILSESIGSIKNTDTCFKSIADTDINTFRPMLLYDIVTKIRILEFFNATTSTLEKCLSTKSPTFCEYPSTNSHWQSVQNAELQRRLK